MSGTLLNWVFGFPVESLTINTDNIPHKDISQLFYGGEGVKNCRGPSGNGCDSSTNGVLGFGFPVESLEGDMMSKASNQAHAAEKRKYRKNKYYFLYNHLLDKHSNLKRNRKLKLKIGSTNLSFEIESITSFSTHFLIMRGFNVIS